MFTWVTFNFKYLPLLLLLIIVVHVLFSMFYIQLNPLVPFLIKLLFFCLLFEVLFQVCFWKKKFSISFPISPFLSFPFLFLFFFFFVLQIWLHPFKIVAYNLLHLYIYMDICTYDLKLSYCTVPYRYTQMHMNAVNTPFILKLVVEFLPHTYIHTYFQ